VACDTSKDDQVKAFQQAFSTWSGGAPPSLLICNAAVVNKPRPLWEVSAAEFDEAINSQHRLDQHTEPRKGLEQSHEQGVETTQISCIIASSG
jgi:NAD(P)-dependent dehydrogenase (short-subunit alcohol dehydrogenase family)